MRSIATISAILVVLVLGSVASAAGADGEAALKRGQEMMAKRDYKGALDAFREAQKLAPSTRATGQIGMALMALGRAVEAEAQLEEALSLTTDPWLAKNRPFLEATLQRVRENLGDLEVVGEPRSAEVEVNDEFFNLLPMHGPRRVPIGALTVRIKRPGYVPEARRLEILPGQTTRLKVSLIPVGEPTALQPSGAALAGAATVAVRPEQEKPGAPGAGSLKPVLWTMAALGAGSLAVGIPLLVKDHDSTAGSILTGLGAGCIAGPGLILIGVAIDESRPGPRISIGPRGVQFATVF